MNELYNPNRKFAIPYGGLIEPEEFLKLIEPYLKNIDNVYFGIYNLIDTDTCGKGLFTEYEKSKRSEENVFKFLAITKNIKNFPKRILLANTQKNVDSYRKGFFVWDHLPKLIEYYNLNGITVADFYTAKLIREEYPNIEIHSSCNSMMETFENVSLWMEEVKPQVLNLSRHSIRNFDLMDKIKSSFDVRLKAIINECCLIGCPDYFNHFCKIGIDRFNVGRCFKNRCGIYGDGRYCDYFKPMDFLKGNFIVPQWYDVYDNYLNIYKLSGRDIQQSKIYKKMLDFYINCEIENISIFDVICGSEQLEALGNSYPFYSKMIPKNLLTCGHVNCEKCGICKKVIEKYFKDAGVIDIDPTKRTTKEMFVKFNNDYINSCNNKK